MKKVLCLLLSALMVFGTMSAAFADDEKAFAPYEETVKVSIGHETVVSLELPDGHDQENNKYNDFLEKALNIDITYDWLVDLGSMNEKVNLAIASGEIPAAMVGREYRISEKVLDSLLLEWMEVD